MKLAGYIDIWADSLIAGWVWDSDHAEKRVAVEILVDEKPLARLTAGQYRENLKNHGIGDEAHAFSYTPSSPIDLKNRRVCVVVADTDAHLRRNRDGPIPPEALRERVAGTKCPASALMRDRAFGRSLWRGRKGDAADEVVLRASARVRYSAQIWSSLASPGGRASGGETYSHAGAE
jgi:hypothetical protein